MSNVRETMTDQQLLDAKARVREEHLQRLREAEAPVRAEYLRKFRRLLADRIAPTTTPDEQLFLDVVKLAGDYEDELNNIW